MQEFVHVGAEGLLVFLRNIDFAEGLASQVEIIINLGFAELTDTNIVVEARLLFIAICI